MWKTKLRKVAKWYYIFLTTPDEVEEHVEIIQSNSSDNGMHHYNVEIFNIADLELKLINTKQIIKNKLKELLSELKKFKVQTILVLKYKKRNDQKIFHSSTKLTARDSDINEALVSMHESIMPKSRNYGSEDWIVLDVITKDSIKFFEC